MSDVKLMYDEDTGEFDVGIVNGDLVAEEGLETAVIISLFSDRMAEGDLSTSEKNDRRGWWADETLPDNDKIGSLLWTQNRQKIGNLDDIEDDARESLQWMIDDGVAESVTVTADRAGVDGIQLYVTIAQPGEMIHKFKLLWGQ